MEVKMDYKRLGTDNYEIEHVLDEALNLPISAIEKLAFAIAKINKANEAGRDVIIPDALQETLRNLATMNAADFSKWYRANRA